MGLQIHNTLTNRLEPFTPLDPAGREVRFYTCGPTVYDYAHIGNFRSFLNADVLRRTLELLGYRVRHVMNITDVGHMTDDGQADGGGEDKMAVAGRRLAEAKKSGKLPPGADVNPNDPFAVAEFYARAFLDDARRLGIKVAIEAADHPERMPRPTRYIAPMIELVRTLIARGHAYVASDGVVYFDVRSFPAYGRLSGNTLDSLREGEGGRIRADHQAVKRHPADFMLWKPDPHHLMKWDSPWGAGYPGWHLECSVMAQALLGKDSATPGVIDVHSGGEDNIFPHHECEIAQSCSATGQPLFARYWFHTRFLQVDGAKMSKSRGNFHTLGDLLARGASPAAVRLELIKTHYRSNANFTMQGLKDSQRMIDRWARLRDWLKAHRATRLPGPGPLAAALDEFTAALCDDLTVGRAIAALNAAAGAHDLATPPHVNGRGTSTLGDELAALENMDGVLGVLNLEREAAPAPGEDDSAAIEARIAERNAARAAKDFKTSDRVRDELLAMGIAIQDGPGGTTWSRIVR
jgi:cysteinyl-tRNA synthetase